MKVNLTKSKVYHIGVKDAKINNIARILCCEQCRLPLNYIGIQNGANIKLVEIWNPIIDKFKKNLSSWKVDNLSFGGRATLVKSVIGNLSLFFLSLYKAPRIVTEVIQVLEGNFCGMAQRKGKRSTR